MNRARGIRHTDTDTDNKAGAHTQKVGHTEMKMLKHIHTDTKALRDTYIETRRGAETKKQTQKL
jgi:hypothetical protein